MPLALVIKSLVSPVSILVSVTVALTTAAPDESVTVPRISPELVLCAKPSLVMHNESKTTNATPIIFLIFRIPPRELTPHPADELPISLGFDHSSLRHSDCENASALAGDRQTIVCYLICISHFAQRFFHCGTSH